MISWSFFSVMLCWPLSNLNWLEGVIPSILVNIWSI